MLFLLTQRGTELELFEGLSLNLAYTRHCGSRNQFTELINYALSQRQKKRSSMTFWRRASETRLRQTLEHSFCNRQFISFFFLLFFFFFNQTKITWPTQHSLHMHVALQSVHIFWEQDSLEFSSGPKIKARPYSALNGSARGPARP